MPTESEWLELGDYLETNVGVQLMHPSEGGINRYGFSAVQSGARINEYPYYVRNMAYGAGGKEFRWTYWSGSYEKIEDYSGDIHPLCFDLRSAGMNFQEPDYGLVVRCIKD